MSVWDVLVLCSYLTGVELGIGFRVGKGVHFLLVLDAGLGWVRSVAFVVTCPSPLLLTFKEDPAAGGV